MSLLDAKMNSSVEITGMEGGPRLLAKLNQYGLFTGDRVRVLKIAPLGGPVLIDAGGREIALGRGIAARIMVEPL